MPDMGPVWYRYFASGGVVVNLPECWYVITGGIVYYRRKLFPGPFLVTAVSVFIS